MRLQAAARRLTPDDLHWHDLANRPRSEDLPRLRAIAERWRMTLASLTALFGAVGIVAAPRAAADLPAVWKATTGGAVLAVFVLLISATWFAGRAAQGRSGRRVPTSYSAFKEFWLAEEVAAVRAIRRSQVMATAGAAVLVTAIGLLWFSPEKATDYLVIDRGTSRQCLPVDQTSNVSIALDAQTRVSISPACSPHP